MKRIKKAVATLTITALALTVTPLNAFAGGHGGGHRSRHSGYNAVTVQYSVCNVDGCNVAGTHTHNNRYYYGHSIADGHDYHLLCGVQECTIVENHEHDGITYWGHHNEDGHSYHDSSYNHYYGDGHTYHYAEHQGIGW